MKESFKIETIKRMKKFDCLRAFHGDIQKIDRTFHRLICFYLRNLWL